MLKEEIVVGKAYVNERACLVREVIEEVGSRQVRYVAFELDSGRLLPARHNVCGRAELKRWADREVGPQERDRIHPYEAESDGGSTQKEGLLPEQARAASDVAPGAHTFPTMK